MGKYSLDSYERYKSLVVRPGLGRTPPLNAGYGQSDPFPRTYPQLKLSDLEALIKAKAEGKPFALVIEPDKDGLLNTAQRMAENRMQRHWQRWPVYAWLSQPPDPQMEEELRNWHVQAANHPGGLGSDLRLKRVACPQTVSSGGALPLRLWFVNTGSSPLYGAHQVLLKLENSTASCSLVLKADPGLFNKMGDIVYNEIVQLPVLPEGDYMLLLGLRRENGHPFYLNIDTKAQDGLYALDLLRIDGIQHPELYTLWDSYYPEGYYPLEDPKEPVSG